MIYFRFWLIFGSYIFFNMVLFDNIVLGILFLMLKTEEICCHLNVTEDHQI